MFTNTKIVLAAALIFGSASAALAADSGENHQDNDRSVLSRSVTRINPAWVGISASAGSAYGYAAPIQKQRAAREHDYSDRTDDNR
ncbi:MAG TPA: hypothetical protein VGN55_18085 [Xanthobacteraceae bacterium]|jgi:hypothetical protein